MGNDNFNGYDAGVTRALHREAREEAMLRRIEREAEEEERQARERRAAGECPECKRLHHLVREREDSYHQQGRMLRQMWEENRRLRQEIERLRQRDG